MFELAYPWALLLLPLPFVIWFLCPRAALALPAAMKIPFYEAVYSIVDQEKRVLARQGSTGIFLIIWVLILLAASAPRWVGSPIPLQREGRNIMLALDLSDSMKINDMMMNGRPASRLVVVKQAAEQFVRERTGDKIGLILFGTRAYLQTPLTYDLHSVLMRIEDATAGLAGNTTSIGDALGLAVKRLQDVPARGRVIILLTDGANNSGVLTPVKAAELAKTDNIKVYTIGLGSQTDAGALSGMFLGMNASADLDEETLQKVAAMTGGQYFRATDPKSLQDIYNTINQLETISQDQANIRPQKDYYPWPLALALLLFLYWFSEKAGYVQKISFRSARVQESGS
ncbi:vWA domain-containing protein [Legionella spiritensis]|uniref:vWA domain-containing protein n=1 Tax=Legionella spiritensis TaxID=452 RepID=UPI000F6D2FAC|nr:VWA domain-containing protein [Legionella spiritensis]VEG91473.1 BatA [Legionella spiritensis]